MGFVCGPAVARVPADPIPAKVVMVPEELTMPNALIELVGDVHVALGIERNLIRVVQLCLGGRTVVAEESTSTVCVGKAVSGNGDDIAGRRAGCSVDHCPGRREQIMRIR